MPWPGRFLGLTSLSAHHNNVIKTFEVTNLLKFVLGLLVLYVNGVHNDTVRLSTSVKYIYKTQIMTHNTTPCLHQSTLSVTAVPGMLIGQYSARSGYVHGSRQLSV